MTSSDLPSSIDLQTLANIHASMRELISLSPQKAAMFFKTGPGEYAEHDQFLGVPVPKIRQLAKSFYKAEKSTLKIVLYSPFNEERLLALIVLTHQYKTANAVEKEEIYQFYLTHLDKINNWNLVDASAHLIVGAHLLQKDKTILYKLLQSECLWHRRVAIISTWYFIKYNDLSLTFELSQLLFKDPHDLIHKAAGWMLREAGKKNIEALREFLLLHAPHMPRTMLRYAIEKFEQTQRLGFLNQKAPIK